MLDSGLVLYSVVKVLPVTIQIDAADSQKSDKNNALRSLFGQVFYIFTFIIHMPQTITLNTRCAVLEGKVKNLDDHISKHREKIYFFAISGS